MMGKLPDGSLLNQLVQLINAGDYMNALHVLDEALEQERIEAYNDGIGDATYGG